MAVERRGGEFGRIEQHFHHHQRIADFRYVKTRIFQQAAQILRRRAVVENLGSVR